MNYYTSQIPVTLAEKLKEKGILIDLVQHNVHGMIYADYAVTYGEVFDWLMFEKGLNIIIEPHMDFAREVIDDTYDYSIVKSGSIHADTPYSHYTTWHETANAAIEKVITLI